MTARERIARIASLFAGLARPDETRASIALRHACGAVALCAGVLAFFHETARLWSEGPPAAIAADDPANGTRFGLPESERRSIFRELATAEPGSRTAAERRFGGQPWSIEDDRAANERDTTSAIAARRHVNLTVIYLILDEGIRARWPGEGGKPLPATVPPLNPRAQ